MKLIEMDLYKYYDNSEELKGHHEADEIVPERIMKLAYNNKKLTSKQEEVISKNAACAYNYARYVIKKPWPKGEDAIASDIYFAWFYARDVLHARFPKAEHLFAKQGSMDIAGLYKRDYEKTFKVKL